MRPDEAYDYLNSFVNYEIQLDSKNLRQLKLQRFFRLLALAENPHQRLAVLHVAGSKGKGSTCSYVAAILQAAGYRVGLYSSPHFLNVRERIRLLEPGVRPVQTEGDGLFSDMLTETDFCRLLTEYRPLLERMRTTAAYGRLTYYEVLTFLAFVIFCHRKVDFAVLETGMGGRLDATNVTIPRVCGITSIGWEHVNVLGPTLTDIASEKAAIIKSGCGKVVVAPQTSDVHGVIRQRCHDQGVVFCAIGEHYRMDINHVHVYGQQITIEGLRGSYATTMSLLGTHQLINVTTAIGMIEALQEQGAAIDGDAVVRGIHQVRLPARLECLQEQPPVFVDAAHTPESVAAALGAVVPFFSGRVIVVFGCSHDKHLSQMMAEIQRSLAGHEVTMILTRAAHPRARTFGIADGQACDFVSSLEITDSVSSAISLARRLAGSDGNVVILGSIFVAAEARLAWTQPETKMSVNA